MKLNNIKSKLILKKSKCCTYVVPKQKNLSVLRGFLTVKLQLKKVRAGRLELPHLAAPDPKSGVSTNSTTPAFSIFYELFLV